MSRNPLDAHEREPAEPVTSVAQISQETLADLEGKFLQAGIEGDTINQIIRVAGPIIQALVTRLIST
ncbi:MAG: hypothetical protein IMZ62_06395 [Chloroflexi bacterium]|nr:hypothetical protein [Chloroflexota bacterium]